MARYIVYCIKRWLSGGRVRKKHKAKRKSEKEHRSYKILSFTTHRKAKFTLISRGKFGLFYCVQNEYLTHTYNSIIPRCRSPPFQSVFQKNRLEENKVKNYRESDYAFNKYSNGIVYRFNDETVEITLEMFLELYPDKTEEDFLRLKELSDRIYYEQDRAENAQTKKNVSLHSLEETLACSSPPVDEQYIKQEKQNQDKKKLDKLFRAAKLTEKQKRRLYLHCVEGKTFRAIADIEGVHWTSVEECVKFALKKLKKYGKKIK